MKQENKFVLPKKWKIQVTKENRLVLGEYYNRNGKKDYEDYNIYGLEEHINQFYSSHNLGDESLCVMNDFQDYKSNFTFNESHRQFYDFKTITFRQFQEHVLKEIPKPEYNPKGVAFNNDVYYNSEFNGDTFETKCGHVYNENKKIIGYKLIKPEYKEAVSKLIDLSLGDFELSKRYPFNFTSSSDWYFELKEMKVLDLFFEPVYETSITLKSGTILSEDDIAEVK